MSAQPAKPIGKAPTPSVTKTERERPSYMTQFDELRTGVKLVLKLFAKEISPKVAEALNQLIAN